MNYRESVSQFNSDSEKRLNTLGKSQIIDLTKDTNEFNNEEGLLLNKIFESKGFITNENWLTSKLISAKVIKFNKQSVICECLISKSNAEIQHREFPIVLFEHLLPLHINFPIKIKVSLKKGSSRTDIIDGRNLGIEREFNELVDWNSLNEFEMDEPI